MLIINKTVHLEKINTLRKNAKVSLNEMALILGYESPNGYYYLESGRVKFPADKLAIIANHFNVTIDELFFENRFTELAK